MPIIVDGSFMCKFLGKIVLGMEKNPFANFGSVKNDPTLNIILKEEGGRSFIV